VNKELRNSLIVVAAVAILFIGGWAVIGNASGVNPPFTVVESHSMQHCQTDDKHSEIGTIDTGDLVLVRSTDKCTITSYVEGYSNGYTMFGDYGDVIIYYRDGHNPVIHRAFIWLEYLGGGKWSAPALENYDSTKWSCTSGTDYNNLSGILAFTEVGVVVDGGKTLSIDLDSMTSHYPTSGYLTVGDSVSNTHFDQDLANNICKGLVSTERIKSIAWVEIPWLGALKLMLGGHSAELDTWASNSKTMLAMTIFGAIISIFGIGYAIDEVSFIREKKKEGA